MVNRQSNLKLTKFKQVKLGGPDMSDLRADLSRILLALLGHRIICKRTDADCSLHPRVFRGIESTRKQ
jgi:hypothetical protein